MRRQKQLICGVLAMSCILCSCGILPTEEEFDAAPVVKEYEGDNYSKYTLVRGDMVKKESVDASFQGTTKAETKGEGMGVRIKEICVKKGQKVSEGDVLVKNYVAEQENMVKNSKRQIENLELQMKQARTMRQAELKKLKKLGGTKEQKENIKAQYDSQIKNCESTLKLVRLDLEEAQSEIEDNYVLSDISGTVMTVNSSFEGGYATEEDVLVTVVGKKRNRFRAKTEYASHFRDGQEVTITVIGQQYKVTAKKSDEKNKIYFYPKTELPVKNGVVGSIDLILKEKKNVLYLPAALVYDMGDKKIVYVEGENGIKTIREVTIGERMGNMLEITNGLKENEQIITN